MDAMNRSRLDRLLRPDTRQVSFDTRDLLAWDSVLIDFLCKLEGLVEAEHIREIEARIGRLTDQKAEVDEGEDDVANVGGGAHAPVIEDQSRHDAVAIQSQVAARLRKLSA